MSLTKDEKQSFKRKCAHFVLEPRLNKIAQVTYRTGEGRRMKTDHYQISKLDSKTVWLDETTWNLSLDKEIAVGNPFPVPLENVHVIVELDKTGLVIFPTLAYKIAHK